VWFGKESRRGINEKQGSPQGDDIQVRLWAALRIEVIIKRRKHTRQLSGVFSKTNLKTVKINIQNLIKTKFRTRGS